MTGSQNAGLSKDEAQIYDRQIRLWGFEAQEKLRTSSILVCGLSGLGAEVVKNLMLCGIKDITLLDEKSVKAEDYDSNFLLSPDSIGKNRASSSTVKAQSLNPMVKCTVEEVSIESKPADFVNSFTLVVLIDQTFEATNKWNKICREKNIKFVSGSVFGWIGYGFFDFDQHYFLMPAKQDHQVFGVDCAVDDTKAVTLEDDQLVKEKISYPSFEDSIRFNWALKFKKRTKQRIPPAYPPLIALIKAQEQNQLSGNTEEDINNVYKIFQKEVNDLNLGEKPLKDLAKEKFEYFFGSQLSPVCATIGGLIGQECIKALSENKEPLRNLFLYSAFHTAGVMMDAS
ncbi:unnamed protein product [Auanema sp. JU1783]|nr:unnamed protein product [Auanema sp. JU1783]